MFRQGDLLFIPLKEKPDFSKGKPVVRTDNVIAKGEVTGHKHRLESGEVMEYFGAEYLILPTDSQVLHEEHSALPLPAGYYLVKRQREYVSEEEARRVYD